MSYDAAVTASSYNVDHKTLLLLVIFGNDNLDNLIDLNLRDLLQIRIVVGQVGQTDIVVTGL